MSQILVGTYAGVRTFANGTEGPTELAGRSVWVLAPAPDGACVAVVSGNQVWRRTAAGVWSHLATAPIGLTSIHCANDVVFCGGMTEATILRLDPGGALHPLPGFEQVPGRATWFPQGPPIHVRALASTRKALLAAVHVGGIPRSADRGASWLPTLPIEHDVHDVRAHPTAPLIAASSAIGLCVSEDDGRSWTVHAAGLDLTDSLAVAIRRDTVLFSIQDGPFAKSARLYRWSRAHPVLEQVRDGLPDWLDGKVDTAHLAAAGDCAALLTSAGTLWVSPASDAPWHRVASSLPAAFSVLVI